MYNTILLNLNVHILAYIDGIIYFISTSIDYNIIFI